MGYDDLAGGVIWPGGEPPDVQVPAPEAMIEREVIFFGTPASFESLVLLYDSRLRMRHLGTLKVSRYCFGVLHSASSGQWCKIGIEPPNWPLFTVMPDAGITAQSVPGERSLLVLLCEPGAWYAIEPVWLELLAELHRLGYIEEPKPKRGGGPSKQDIVFRATCVLKWQLAREKEKRLGADPFVARDKTGVSGSTLGRYAKDPEVLAYIEHNRAAIIASLDHN